MCKWVPIAQYQCHKWLWDWSQIRMWCRQNKCLLNKSLYSFRKNLRTLNNRFNIFNLFKVSFVGTKKKIAWILQLLCVGSLAFDNGYMCTCSWIQCGFRISGLYYDICYCNNNYAFVIVNSRTLFRWLYVCTCRASHTRIEFMRQWKPTLSFSFRAVWVTSYCDHILFAKVLNFSCFSSSITVAFTALVIDHR